jgi:hypothetical protein
LKNSSFLKKPQAKLKKKLDTSTAPIGGNILPFFLADVEGKREYENPKVPE